METEIQKHEATWHRCIVSRKDGTGTQAFKLQQPLFSLPMKQCDQRCSQIFPTVSCFPTESGLPRTSAFRLMYVGSIPDSICAGPLEYKLRRSESLAQDLQNRSPNSHSTQAKSLSLIQLPGAPPNVLLLLTWTKHLKPTRGGKEVPVSGYFCLLPAPCKPHCIWKRASLEVQRLLGTEVNQVLGASN